KLTDPTDPADPTDPSDPGAPGLPCCARRPGEASTVRVNVRIRPPPPRSPDRRLSACGTRRPPATAPPPRRPPDRAREGPACRPPADCPRPGGCWVLAAPAAAMKPLTSPGPAAEEQSCE